MTPDLIVLKSIFKKLRELFVDGTMLGVPANVYTEDDMRAGTAPVFPFVYVINFGNLFEVQHLPVVIVQITIYSVPIEMGGDPVLDVMLDFHIFGRDAVNTKHIMGAFRQIQSWPIYDFSDVIVPITEDAPIIENDRGYLWDESPHKINDNSLGIEASLLAWNTMSCYIQVTSL